MSSNFRKDNLEEKISELGIYLNDKLDWTNERLIKRLGDYYIENSNKPISWGARYVQSLETVQLCHHLKDDIKNFKGMTSPLESEDYISEYKMNGFRFIMTYDPKEGFHIFSRKESSTNYLNGEFTEKVLFIEKGLITLPKDYIGKFNYRFVIDGEVTVDGANASFEGVEYESVEDFIQAVLGSDAERARMFQKRGHKLKFTAFDVLYFEKDPTEEPPEVSYNYEELVLNDKQANWVDEYYSDYLETAGFVKARKRAKKLYSYLFNLRNTPKYDTRKFPFIKRRAIRKVLIQFLKKNGLPIEEIVGEDFYKMAFLDTVLREGGEGIILKNLNAPYIAGLKSSRSHRANFKVKQTITQLMANSDITEDFDVFITGANPPKSDRIKDMIGSLSCSVYVIDEFGETRIHEIANVSGLSHEWKRKFAEVNYETGEIKLNPEYLNKVISINGMALSGSNLKFHHAVLKDKNHIEFKSKNPTACTWDKEALESMTLIRGK